jgi:hypothetical protein
MSEIQYYKGKKGGGCFPSGTMIEAPDGHKPIQEFQVGDPIWCYNSNGELIQGQVKEAFKHSLEDTENRVLYIYHESGVLRPTFNHYILTEEGKYKEAKDFKIGEKLTNEAGDLKRILAVIPDPDEYDYTYNLTVFPFPTYIADGIKVHNKGGGKGGGSEQRTPVEDANSLQARGMARLIDIMCEGEIHGLVDGAKSIFFDEVVHQNDDNSYNFDGVTYYERKGTADQDIISGFKDSEGEHSVQIEVTEQGGGIIRQITDTEVDDVRVTVQVPQLYQVNNETGDIQEHTVQMQIHVQPFTGNFSSVATINLAGKCTSAYQRSVRITGLANYGPGPWKIKVTRTTKDSDSVYFIDRTYWFSYTELINERFSYPHSALIGLEVNAEQFGDRIPNRYYHIKGMKIKYPSNYNPTTRVYTGEWNGTFVTGWTDNPAWVYYDLVNNSRYGLGLNAAYIDKWGLYTIAQYCDTLVDDGFGSTEPRFTFNGVIQSRAEAYFVMTMICSCFRAMPYWASNTAYVSQDSPKAASKLVTAASVIGGEFIYESSGLTGRRTVANVTWNDPADFYRPAVEQVQHDLGVNRYGFKPIDVQAYGCTSRGQAHRLGKWIIDSEYSETELVRYRASWDHVDVVPGDIIKIADPHYASNAEFGGRIDNATTTSITLDREVTLDGVTAYTLWCTLPDNTIEEKDVLSGVGTHTTLTTVAFSSAPQKHALWVLTSNVLTTRDFRVLTIKESEPHIAEIHALEYDATKFARVEQDIYLDTTPVSQTPSGPLIAPTGLTIQEYHRMEGQNSLFGVIISWEPSADNRVILYEAQIKQDGDYQWTTIGNSTTNSITIQSLEAGTYDFRVRARSYTLMSSWISTSEVIDNDPDAPPDIEGLQVAGGGTQYTGKNIEIEWTESADPKILNYKVDVYMYVDDVFLRTEYVPVGRYTYFWDYNLEDNGGVGKRAIRFRVYGQDVHGKFSNNPAVLVASNPPPDMSGSSPTITPIFNGLKIDWGAIQPADTDLDKYKVYISAFSPPTDIVGVVDKNTLIHYPGGLRSDTTYYVQIEPWDLWGPGTKTTPTSGYEPLEVPQFNIDSELSENITMTDFDGNNAAALISLYDRNKTSGGVSYTIGGTDKWIDYTFPIKMLIDRIAVWVSDSMDVYVAYTEDGTTWNWLKAEADHTLTSTNELLAGANQADCQTNYWTLPASGKHVAIFPQQTVAKAVRLYMMGSVTRSIYELVFFREVLAEYIIADYLSAISANLGTITAGILQSPTWDADNGMLFDLIAEAVKFGGATDPKFDWDGGTNTLNIGAVVTFESASSGYSNISDKPTDLGDINEGEGTKLTGIATGADVTGDNTADDTDKVGGVDAATIAGWKYAGQTTIDGGDIQTDTITAVQIGANEIITVEANIDNAVINTLHLAEAAVTDFSNYFSTGDVSINAWTYGTWYDLFELDYDISPTQTDYGLIISGQIGASTSSFIDSGYINYSVGLEYKWIISVVGGATIRTFTDRIGQLFTVKQAVQGVFFYQEDSGGNFNAYITDSSFSADDTVRLTLQARRITGGGTSATVTGDISLRFGSITGLKK